ncbi:hypothetical protein [Mycobacterium sp. 155]|uniref:hypothetical protein n=1 Tax=Mycobacterium sp. 155 TaxID=1157943 RepID=UPI000362EDE5|nr:hypothetical protein [Mycobacterium sp. 155]
MSGSHPDLGPELRQLAQAILDRIDPAVRLAAAGLAASAAGEPGKCQQVWCPVCALVALINGEEHPLLGVVAEHSVALLTVVRAMLDNDGEDPTGPPEPDGGSDTPPPDGAPSSGPGRYQRISVTVED